MRQRKQKLRPKPNRRRGFPWLLASTLVMAIAVTTALCVASIPKVNRPRLPYSWMTEHDVLVPLGVARVTRYTHNEGGRWTSSGYKLRDQDEGLVCAISRDWWRKLIHPRDRVYIEGFTRPCEALDTMADANCKGFKQRHWIDVYATDVEKALDFGIQKRRAWLVKRK